MYKINALRYIFLCKNLPLCSMYKINCKRYLIPLKESTSLFKLRLWLPVLRPQEPVVRVPLLTSEGLAASTFPQVSFTWNGTCRGDANLPPLPMHVY